MAALGLVLIVAIFSGMFTGWFVKEFFQQPEQYFHDGHHITECTYKACESPQNDDDA